MDEKVTMAVTAHVRHTHTSYDSILSSQDRRKGTKDSRRKEARTNIRHDQDAVLDSWRGLKATAHSKSTRVLGLAPPVRKANPKLSHRAINTPIPMVATETRKRHRTVDATQETLPTSKRPKRQAAVEAQAIISHGRRCVSRESSEGLSEEYVDLLSDDGGDDDDDDVDDDLSECSTTVTTHLSLIPTSAKFKNSNLPSPTSRVKTRKTMEQSQRAIMRSNKDRRGLKQQMEAAEDHSPRANGLDTSPVVIMIEDNRGDEFVPRREWKKRSQNTEDDEEDSIVLFKWPVLKSSNRITGAEPGAAGHRPCTGSKSGHRKRN